MRAGGCGQVAVQAGDVVAHGEPAHLRADLGDRAAHVPAQSDLSRQAEPLVGGPEAITVSIVVDTRAAN
jgi:hypothetical protein